MGFKAYGGRPSSGTDSRQPSGSWSPFLLVCIVECAAGWLLWGGHRNGAGLALASLPVAGLF
jgi:hypothetical protein